MDAQTLAILESNGSVPRYTSYPTAPHFEPGCGAKLIDGLLAEAASGKPISTYIHVPFCDRLCWFCGCNTKHTLKYEPVRAYIDSVLCEIETLKLRLSGKPAARHIHFGGGSPSMLSADDMARLGDSLRDVFDIGAGTEISVEIDPSDFTDETLDGLKRLGVTRISVGVQDFDPLVQQAINRPQTFEQTRDVIEAVRSLGIASVNVDALYGLPHQTMARFQRTLDQVVALAPDRIALFGYAHVPWVKKHQKMIDEAALPDMAERFAQANDGAAQLVAAGYAAIGIDHFAKPSDDMAVAAANGNLRRNFQGYTTDDCAVLLPIGGSSIGKFSGGFVQNEVATARYQEMVNKGQLPASRGYALNADDIVRAFIIERLMCDFSIDFAALPDVAGVVDGDYLAEAENLVSSDLADLCSMSGTRLEILPDRRVFTRIVASKFDAYIAQKAFRYSKAV